MNRRRLAVFIGVIVSIAAAVFMLWPSGSADQHIEETSEEAELPEGLVLLGAEQIEASQIEVETVGQGSAVELVFPATVAASPTASARIDARAAGVVRSVGKTLGDYVRQGETIARIESADAAALAAQLSAAGARVNELSAAYDRERRLFEANVTARQDLEAARANLQVAQSELARAQAAVSAAGVSGDGRSLAVTSPLAGRVTSAPIVLGSFVEAGEELYQVVNPSGMQVEVALPSAEASRIQPGDEATLEIADNREVGARVRSVTPSLDPESRSATAVLSLARPIPGLQPGAFLQARIRPSGEVDNGRMSVPESAVQTIDGAEVVFVRTRRGFQTRRVVTGARSGGRVVIESGLEANWRIATANAFLLKAELEKEEAEHGH
ncbi:efflux RND transporter periplasmic adaptor subunit [Citromicrobium bathyomarinum]|uniref:efflux RND transporter periplasmic adaptor subunit n=1 Tax=Citromicrobium bathyomarinum TaxID=72174 RepID=UPI001E5B34ED|nr:efflux RND transporter periplasmic adaptor subunit [Citromicrobium bathyomarinum]MCD1622570.1 efflux RND transporter periplasmic adaptor subunit [Citromicrobium bathyomarinum]